MKMLLAGRRADAVSRRTIRSPQSRHAGIDRYRPASRSRGCADRHRGCAAREGGHGGPAGAPAERHPQEDGRPDRPRPARLDPAAHGGERQDDSAVPRRDGHHAAAVRRLRRRSQADPRIVSADGRMCPASSTWWPTRSVNRSGSSSASSRSTTRPNSSRTRFPARSPRALSDRQAAGAVPAHGACASAN